jgi:hypothetical protein
MALFLRESDEFGSFSCGILEAMSGKYATHFRVRECRWSQLSDLTGNLTTTSQNLHGI